jgi:hypothetical protein
VQKVKTDACAPALICDWQVMKEFLTKPERKGLEVENVQCGSADEPVAFSGITRAAQRLEIALHPFTALGEWDDVVHVKIINL